MAMNVRSSSALSNCLHKGITRLTSEKLLLGKENGSFLIRDSETIPGAFTLCLLYDNHVHQYRILPDAEGKLSVQCEATVKSKKFSDLISLLQEYTQRGQKNGLAGALLYPVPVESSLVSDDDSDDDVIQDENLQFEIFAPTEDCDGLMTIKTNQKELDDFIYRYFLQRFKHLNMSSCDGAFAEKLHEYVESGTARDCQTATSGEKTMHRLRSVLDQSAVEIDRCIDSLMLKIDLCRQLFGPMTTTPLSKAERDPNEKVDISSVLEKIARCKGAIQNLERKAELKYRDLTSMWKEGGMMIPESGNVSPTRGMPTKPMIPAMSFEARVAKLGKLSKIKLTVDIQAGKLLTVKPNKESLNDKNMFMHDQIEQLIKSSQKKSYLDVLISGSKRTYVFEDTKQRENFCQLVQQLKNMHGMDSDNISQISIFVGSWNMGSEIPLYSLVPWITSSGQGKKLSSPLSAIPHDVYVIGTQESVISDKEWCNKLKTLLLENFGEQFHLVTCCSLWSIRVVVLVKLKHKNKISLVQQTTVRTGIANALGNKGAAAVSFSFNGTSMCFVNAHLTSGLERLKRRNQNFRDIIKSLNLGPKIFNQFDSTNHFHHMFFFGDLNYRLDELEPQEIVQKVDEYKSSGSFAVLLENDQLKRIQKYKEAFVGFKEEEITFVPTYRFRKGTKDRYAWEKHKTTGVRINAPSWCDRILWRSYPDTRIANTSYGSVDTICSSDHKPVFATFDIRVITQFTTPKGGSASSGDMKIVFSEVKAEVKCSKQENFKIGFHSSCLEVPADSKQNSSFGGKKEGFCCPIWSSSSLIELQPILDDWDYLEDQHILLSVKTADGMESYGECVIALKTMFAVTPQQFSAVLTHAGEETGTLWGLMHVKAKDTSNFSIQGHKTRKAYELIYMDTELMQDDSSALAAAQAQIYQDVVDLRPPSNTAASKRSDSTKPAPSLYPNLPTTRSKSTVTPSPSLSSSSSPWQLQAGSGGARVVSGAGAACGGNLGEDDTDLKKLSGKVETTHEMNRYSDWPTKGAASPDAAEKEAASYYEDVAPSIPPRFKPGVGKTDTGKGTVNNQDGKPYSQVVKSNTSTGPQPFNRSFSTKGDGNKLESPQVAPKPGSFREAKPRAPVPQIRPRAQANVESSYGFCGEAGGLNHGGQNSESVVYSEETTISNTSAPPIPVNRQSVTRSQYSESPEADYDLPVPQKYRDSLAGGVSNGRVPRVSNLGQSDLIDLSSPANTMQQQNAAAEAAVQAAEDVNARAVSDWLVNIGMSQYQQLFIDNGWDHLDFITDITLEDLQQMGIPSLDHRLKILQCIDNLKNESTL